jgi:hypothetical protein
MTQPRCLCAVPIGGQSEHQAWLYYFEVVFKWSSSHGVCQSHHFDKNCAMFKLAGGGEGKDTWWIESNTVLSYPSDILGPSKVFQSCHTPTLLITGYSCLHRCQTPWHMQHRLWSQLENFDHAHTCSWDLSFIHYSILLSMLTTFPSARVTFTCKTSWPWVSIPTHHWHYWVGVLRPRLGTLRIVPLLFYFFWILYCHAMT